jgi:hypothetical protein
MAYGIWWKSVLEQGCTNNKESSKLTKHFFLQKGIGNVPIINDSQSFFYSPNFKI